MIAPRPPRLLSILALAALSGLAGCSSSDISRSFGLVRDAPDEFMVTTRAPLSMPPDYTVRPPRPGASRPQEAGAANEAAAVLAPQAALVKPAQASRGEQSLLSAAGPTAPGDIRAKIEADSAISQTSGGFTDRLLFWRTPNPPGTIIDAQKEAERLRQNAALGQPPDAGDTPIIQRKAKGFFD